MATLFSIDGGEFKQASKLTSVELRSSKNVVIKNGAHFNGIRVKSIIKCYSNKITFVDKVIK